MKYNLHINQKSIIDNKYPLTVDDAIILNVMHDCFASTDFQKVISETKIYTWISYTLLLKELPMLGKITKSGEFKTITKDAMYRKVSRLVDLGFLDKMEGSQSLGKTFYSSTKKLDSLYRETTYGKNSEGTEKTPNPYGKNSEPPTEKTPNYNNTNNNNTNNNIVKEVKTSKSIPFKDEFLEIFKILKEHSGNDFRINLNRLQSSNKYKDFVRFFKTYKSEYTFEEVKEVIKYTAVKNLGTDSQKYTNFSTLFRAKNFERNFDFWLTSKNKDSKPLNTTSNTNTPIQQIKLTGLNLDRFKHLYEQLNDNRFTESTFLNVFGGKKYDAVRNRKTPREIVRAIQAGLNSLSQAFNKNRSLSELIIEKL